MALDNGFNFTGECENIKYGLTDDEAPVDLKLKESKFDCHFEYGEPEGFIIVKLDLPGNDTFWKQAWKIGIMNPIQPYNEATVKMWFMDQYSAYTPYYGYSTSDVFLVVPE